MPFRSLISIYIFVQNKAVLLILPGGMCFKTLVDIICCALMTWLSDKILHGNY